ncbi:MAG: succinate dehydrogenase cytochrome b subunit [Actinobacteria bacterium]|nr:succinate dehydrogenase cytochrome b subunit [Actinomycetota bacterium]MCB9390551.1 succinate dehydrogenase cytochrome b subunit [Acidimicrobiia bacterium]
MSQTTSDRARAARHVEPIKPPKKGKNSVVGFYQTAIGKKYVMAISGIMLLGFVFFHMIGNLKIYLGEDDFNHYAEFLRELLVPIVPRTVVLWLMRGGLVIAFVAHIHSAYTLTVINKKARPVGYQSPRDYQVADYAARTMRYTGIIVGLYLIYHLMQLTWGVGGTEFERGDAYANVVHGLENVPIALVYIVANIALGIHIFHGAWSMFQSLGLNNPRFNSWRKYFAIAFSAIITIGNVSIPIAVMTGIAK